MNEQLKENITRRLDELPDDVGRQLLDYIEFLDSKYNRSTRERTTFERITEGLEGRLGVGGLGSAAVKGTSQVLDTAGHVVRGVAAAGRAVVEEIQRAERSSETAEPADEEPLAAEDDGSTEASSEPQDELVEPPVDEADRENTS